MRLTGSMPVKYTNNPQSAYALHILHNRHEYGEEEPIMELVKACRKSKLMNCWESLYIQEYHRKPDHGTAET